MKILGVDPGLRYTGYGLIEEKSGVVKLIEAGFVATDSRRTIETRLKRIYKALQDLVCSCRPDVLVLEKLYSHYRHPTTACLLGHVRGAICLLAAQENIKLIEYGSTRIKKSMLGRGHATKSQIQHMVQMTLNLQSKKIRDDITDALALALVHIKISRVKI
ncbi:crossover junction endodeoxyribonuclease RuvC [Candidatus Omnitrophota bacterium]